jgi:predicted nicotinamide N-methyase
MLYITGPTWDFASIKINSTLIQIPSTSAQISNHMVSTSSTVWDCSIVLAKMLERMNLDLVGTKVIEIGAGRGVVSISAKLLGADVVATDMPQALPALRSTLELNGLTCGRDVEVKELDWNDRNSELYSRKFNYVLAADVVWMHELVHPSK